MDRSRVSHQTIEQLRGRFASCLGHKPHSAFFYLEDNPLIVLHVQSMIEDLGHTFVGSLGSFAELQACIDQFEMDGALIDIDLTDGPTGPAAAAWLLERGIASIFVTGQEQSAAQYASVSLGIIGKPVVLQQLAAKLALFVPH